MIRGDVSCPREDHVVNQGGSHMLTVPRGGVTLAEGNETFKASGHCHLGRNLAGCTMPSDIGSSFSA